MPVSAREKFKLGHYRSLGEYLSTVGKIRKRWKTPKYLISSARMRVKPV
jgi:hypothetical protein